MELNTVIIAGNLCKDPELKYLAGGTAICGFAIAVNKTYTANNEKKQEVTFLIVNTFGKTAENVSKYLTKGSGVIVEGSVEQSRWTDTAGNNKEKVRIVARKVNFMPKKQDKSMEEKIADEELIEAQTTNSIKPEDIDWAE